MFDFIQFSASITGALNNLLAKSDVKLKNEKLEEQFRLDLIHKQLKAFDDLWQKLEMNESVAKMKKETQEKPKLSASKRYQFPNETNGKQSKYLFIHSIVVAQVRM